VLASQVGEGLDRPSHDVADRIAGVLRTPTAELALKCLAQRHQLLAAELATLKRRQRCRFRALMVNEVELTERNTISASDVKNGVGAFRVGGEKIDRPLGRHGHQLHVAATSLSQDRVHDR